MPAVLALVVVSVSRNVLLNEDGLPSAGSGFAPQGSRFAGHFYDLVADKLLILKFLGEQPVALRAHDFKWQGSFEVAEIEIYPFPSGGT